jgi:hypothetical protein
MAAYFSDRKRGPRPRTNETIDAAVWGGVYAIVSSLLSNQSFGHTFPETCPDGHGIIGHDNRSLVLMLKAQHPDMPYPLPLDETPDTMAILDLLEFVAASIGKPVEGSSNHSALLCPTSLFGYRIWSNTSAIEIGFHRFSGSATDRQRQRPLIIPVSSCPPCFAHQLHSVEVFQW